MCCRLKYLLLLFYACIITLQTFCQFSNDSISLYDKVIRITNTYTANTDILKKLYDLKHHLDSLNQKKDSGDVLIFIKLAKYEFLTNQNIDIALQHCLTALNVSQQLEKNISKTLLTNLYFNTATFYDRKGLYNKELSYFDTVIQLTLKSDPENYLSFAREYKARIYYTIGDYQKAVYEYTFAMSAIKLKTNADSSRFTKFLNYRAQSYLFENQLFQSLSDVENAIVLAKKLNNHLEIATAYKTKALVYKKKQKNKEAEYFFKQGIKERLLTNDNNTIANDYNDLGNFYQENLQDYKNAKLYYYLALRFTNKITDNKIRSINLFMVYENLGNTATEEGELSTAIHYYKIALASINIHIDNLQLGNPSIAQITFIQNSDLIFDFLFGKIDLLLALYRQKKQTTYLDASLKTALLTDSVITQTRHNQIEEKSKLYWRDKTSNFFQNAIETCYLLDSVGKAFYFLEKSRAVLLNDGWNEAAAKAQLSSTETVQLDFLRTKIIEEEQHVSLLLPSSNTYKDKENNLLQTKDSLERIIKSLEKKYPLYYQTKYADEVPSLQSLQEYLAKTKQSLVYYFMNDSAIYAMAITKTKINFIKIAPSEFNSIQLFQFIKLCSDKQQLNRHYNLYCSLSCKPSIKNCLNLCKYPKAMLPFAPIIFSFLLKPYAQMAMANIFC